MMIGMIRITPLFSIAIISFFLSVFSNCLTPRGGARAAKENNRKLIENQLMFGKKWFGLKNRVHYC